MNISGASRLSRDSSFIRTPQLYGNQQHRAGTPLFNSSHSTPTGTPRVGIPPAFHRTPRPVNTPNGQMTNAASSNPIAAGSWNSIQRNQTQVQSNSMSRQQIPGQLNATPSYQASVQFRGSQTSSPVLSVNSNVSYRFKNTGPQTPMTQNVEPVSQLNQANRPSNVSICQTADSASHRHKSGENSSHRLTPCVASDSKLNPNTSSVIVSSVQNFAPSQTQDNFQQSCLSTPSVPSKSKWKFKSPPSRNSASTLITSSPMPGLQQSSDRNLPIMHPIGTTQTENQRRTHQKGNENQWKLGVPKSVVECEKENVKVDDLWDNGMYIV